MDQECAVIFLDTPSRFDIGVDYAEWRTENRDKKKKTDDVNVWVISGMSAGAHFVFWKETDEPGKTGEFVHLAQREVCVFKWSPKQALFLKVTDEDEVERFRLGHQNFSLLTQSVLYPKEFQKPWTDVSFCITRCGIRRVQGDALTDSRLREYAAQEDSATTAFDDRLERLESLWRWSDLPKRKISGATPAEVSAAAMDRSPQLRQLLNAQTTENQGFDKSELMGACCSLNIRDPRQLLLLGEFQLSYLAFLLGADLDAMEHWKAMMFILSNAECLCEDEMIPFALNLIRVLYGQIDQCPEDLMMSDLTRSNFIISGIISVFEVLQSSVNPTVQRRLKLLQDLIEKKFHMTLTELWTLQEEGPNIVDDTLD